MLESNIFPTTWDSDIFSNWNSESLGFENLDYIYDLNSDRSTCDLNSNSSDIDDLNIDTFDNLPLSDAFVSQILGEGINIENPSLDEFYDHQNVYQSDNDNSSIKSPKRKHLFLSSKSWSNMSIEEKEKSLITISEMTCKMGIREQVEVIGILDPNVKISAEMKEYALDIVLLDDSKWKRIKDYFKKHNHSISKSNFHKTQSTVKSTKNFSKKSSSVSSTTRKQKQKKQKIRAETDHLKKSRKIAKQGRKEERSGLFVYEKVVKFSSLEEDEDVNILE